MTESFLRKEVALVDHIIQVFVVDDQKIIRNGLKALLSGFDDIQVVGFADNGSSALPLVEQLKPDVVLVDMIMPKMGGIETIQRIMAIQPQLCAIAMTAQLVGDFKILAMHAGAVDYITKDSRPEELIRSIRAAYERKLSIQEIA
jgi:DNA-binding NarL/FixJ family response regulator